MAGCGGGGGSEPSTTSNNGLINSAQAASVSDGNSSEDVFNSAPTQAQAEALADATITPVVSTISTSSSTTTTPDVATTEVGFTDVVADASSDGGASNIATAAAVPLSTSCTSLPALPLIPTDALKVTDFGAIPNDNLPDDDAIARALKALKPGQWLIFPAGRYIQARSIYVTVPNAVLWGQGATILATNPDDQTIGLNADGASVYGFTLTAVTDYRRTAARHARISIYRDNTIPGLQSGNVVRRNLITNTAGTPSGGSGGILVYRAKDFTVAENTIRRTLADGIHITNGSNNGKVMLNTVTETGDDMIGIVSYMGAGWQTKVKTVPNWVADFSAAALVHDIYVANNDLGGNYWGRGVGIVGASNITIKNNNIHNVTRAAGILIGQEANYYTFGTKNIFITGNTISKIQTTAAAYVPAADTNLQRMLTTTNVTGHGGIEIYAYGNSSTDFNDPLLRPLIAVSNIQIQNNAISDVVRDAVRIGVSSAAQLVGQSTIKGNVTKAVHLKAINNVLPTTAKSFCSGNTQDGNVATDASCVLTEAAAPVVTGASLRCNGALK
jgi:parallel beta-helix repeat protein